MTNNNLSNIFPFGKYEGKDAGWTAEVDSSYAIWWYKNVKDQACVKKDDYLHAIKMRSAFKDVYRRK